MDSETTEHKALQSLADTGAVWNSTTVVPKSSDDNSSFLLIDAIDRTVQSYKETHFNHCVVPSTTTTTTTTTTVAVPSQSSHEQLRSNQPDVDSTADQAAYQKKSTKINKKKKKKRDQNPQPSQPSQPSQQQQPTWYDPYYHSYYYGHVNPLQQFSGDPWAAMNYYYPGTWTQTQSLPQQQQQQQSSLETADNEEGPADASVDFYENGVKVDVPDVPSTAATSAQSSSNVHPNFRKTYSPPRFFDPNSSMHSTAATKNSDDVNDENSDEESISLSSTESSSSSASPRNSTHRKKGKRHSRHHEPVAPPLSPELLEDEDLANLLLSWYHSGYWTGYYQAKKQFSNNNRK